jgi:hypothetical protein
MADCFDFGLQRKPTQYILASLQLLCANQNTACMPISSLIGSCLCVSAKLNFIFAVGNLITLTDKRALRADKAKIYSKMYANI